MFYIHSKNEGHTAVLYIEGSLNSGEEIEKLIREKLQPAGEGHHSFIIDLSKTEFISEKYFKLFQDISLKQDIEFRNYSLYIGLQLNEYKLIPFNRNTEVYKNQ